jgi:hypothetical protein
MRKDNSRKNRLKREEVAMAAREPTNLRAPIACIMGHVDTGMSSYALAHTHTYTNTH